MTSELDLFYGETWWLLKKTVAQVTYENCTESTVPTSYGRNNGKLSKSRASNKWSQPETYQNKFSKNHSVGELATIYDSHFLYLHSTELPRISWHSTLIVKAFTSVEFHEVDVLFAGDFMVIPQLQGRVTFGRKFLTLFVDLVLDILMRDGQTFAGTQNFFEHVEARIDLA